jgi:hypothetical protein
MPVTIRALNDGRAFIDGQGVRETVIIEGTLTDYRHDLVLEGFVSSNSLKHVYKLKLTRRLIMRRLSGENAVNIDGNYSVFQFDRCEDVVVEDCAAYGSGRILFSYYCGLRGTFRRCWGRWKDNRYGKVKTALACYGSGDCIVENCVMTMEPDVEQSVEGIKINRRDGNPYGSRNKIYGNVVYGLTNSSSPGFMTQGNELMDDNEWLNNVSIRNTVGCSQRNDSNLLVNRITIAESIEKGFSQTPYCKSKPAYDCSWRVYTDIQNASFVNAPIGISRNESPIVLQTRINPQYDINTYGIGAYLIVPPALKGKGRGGDDIGAEVLFRYINGQLTNEPLWPWPMEDRILSETGVSVTFEGQGGIWKTLPDFEGYLKTPDQIRIEN